MGEQASRRAGLARALAMSWLAVAVSSGAHLVAHGQHPSLPVTAAFHAVVAFGLLPVSLSRLAFLPTFLAVTAAQLVVHAGLSALALGEAAAPAVAARLAGRAHHTAGGPVGLPASGAGEHAMSASLLPTPTMAGFHVLAAALLALLLTRTERAFTLLLTLSSQLWCLLTRAFLAALGHTAAVGNPVGRAPTSARVLPRLRDLCRAGCRAPRGPPAIAG